MDKRRILIVADNARRDFVATRLLQRGFQKRGTDVRLSTLLDMVPNLRRFKPHAVMSNRANMDFARPASKCCRIYIFPAEGGHLTKETMLSVFMGRSYWKLDSVDWIRRCYVWSEYVRNSLLETGMFRPDQLMVAGSVRLDPYRHHIRTRKIPSDPKDFVLGVAFSAKSTSAYYGPPHSAESYMNFHPEDSFPVTPPGRNFEDICWRDQAILRLSMRYLKRFLKDFPGKVILRPSPFEDEREFFFLEKRYPGRVKVVVNIPMLDFLEDIDALLTCWSTTGLEALIMGVPVISIAGTMDQEHLFRHVDKVASGFEKFVPAYHLPLNEEALFELLGKAQKGMLPVSPKSREEITQLLKDLYNWPYEKPAHEVIVNDVLQDLENFQETPDEVWREALPIPHGVPLVLTPLAYWARNQYRFYKRGNYKTLRDFYRLKDSRVDSLILRTEQESAQDQRVHTLCWE